MTIDITEENFDQEVLKGLVFIDCYADWCSPCKALKPLLLDLEKNNEKLKLGLLDIDHNPSLAVRLKVASIPKVVVFRDGEEITSITGVRPKADYQELIDSL